MLPSATRLWCVRSFVRGARKRAKAVELGWDEMRAQLLNVPLAVPRLKSLEVRHGVHGSGHTGARKFAQNFLAKMRYQNPTAEIFATALPKDERTSTVWLQMEDQTEGVEIDVTGENTETIGAQVLRAAGVADAEVEVSVSAMAAWQRGYAEQTPPRPKWAAHDKWRRRWRPITPVEAPEADAGGDGAPSDEPAKAASAQ